MFKGPERYFMRISCSRVDILSQDKMANILETTFSNALFWMKTFESHKFNWIIFLWVLLTISWRTGSGNGSVPFTWQAVSWTDVDQEVLCHMASPGHKELIRKFHKGTGSNTWPTEACYIMYMSWSNITRYCILHCNGWGKTHGICI